MEISSVEEYITYYMATNVLKETLGDGAEFELICQALLDQIQSQSSSTSSTTEEATNTISSSYNGSLDSLAMVMVGDETSTSNSPISLESLNTLLGTANSTTISNLANTMTNYSSSSSSESSADLEEIYSAVEKYSSMYGIDSNLVLSIIKAESNFDSTATSSVGAQGLMQVMPSNLSSYGVTDGYDVEQNISAGVQLLSSYLNQYSGNVEMALMAYNGGPGTMANRGVESSDDLYKMPEETQNYVPKVLGFYSEFSA